MSLDKFTMDDLKNAEIDWKATVAQNEMNLLNYFKQKKDFSLAYKNAENNAWIVRTLRDKKQRYRFNECKNLVLVGSGMYPYSMFDVHKQYPEINQIGLEIDENRAKVSELLIKASPAKDKIKIVVGDAIDYDYSWLGDDDLIFISVDVEHNKIFSKAIQTSKAHVHVCAPYDKTWMRSLVRSFSA